MSTQPSPVGFIEALAGLLAEVTSRAGDRFSGIGLIICDAPEQLPILPLRDSAPELAAGDQLGGFLERYRNRPAPITTASTSCRVH